MPLAYGLIDPIDLPLPGLAPALEGLRIAHVTDLHIRRDRRRWRDLADQLNRLRVDLLVMTGDYMSHPGDEPTAARVLERLIDGLRPRHGSVAVFGNHDTSELRDRLAHLPVTWLHNEVHRLETTPTVEVLGLGLLASETGDAPALALQATAAGETDAGVHAGRDDDRPLRVMLAHRPEAIPIGADLGLDLVLTGHTHGGQCRMPGKRALHNSSSFPLAMSAGLFRHRHTLGVIARGAGEIALPLRTFCPPHVPLYTLRRRPMPGQPSSDIHPLLRW